MGLNSLPTNKILDLSKLKAFADDKSNATQKLKFVLGRVKNILGKGENAGYQHFLRFLQCFQKLSFSESLKVRIVWQRVSLSRALFHASHHIIAKEFVYLGRYSMQVIT